MPKRLRCVSQSPVKAQTMSTDVKLALIGQMITVLIPVFQDKGQQA